MAKSHKRTTPDALKVWMNPMEFAQVAAVFEALAPRNVLEWGAGGSTQAILARFPFIERMVSVEHHPDWHAIVREKVPDPRLEVHHIAADIPPYRYDVSLKKIAGWIDLAEVDPAVMASYVAFPRSLGVVFDVILVDGRARTFCLEAGWEILAPGGAMILHDAQRPIYHTATGRFPRAAFLEPWRQGQVCIMRKPADPAPS